MLHTSKEPEIPLAFHQKPFRPLTSFSASPGMFRDGVLSGCTVWGLFNQCSCLGASHRSFYLMVLLFPCCYEQMTSMDHIIEGKAMESFRKRPGESNDPANCRIWVSELMDVIQQDHFRVSKPKIARSSDTQEIVTRFGKGGCNSAKT